MGKANTPSFILELALKTETWQEHILAKRLDIARHIYNACLGELMKRYRKMKQDTEYLYWLKQKESKERTKGLKELSKAYGLNEYALHAFVKPMQQHFKSNIDSNTSQKIATRAWQAFEKRLYKEAKNVYFKRKGQLYSVEGKSNASGIRFKEETVLWNGLQIPVVIKANDLYAQVTLTQSRVKYCRIVRKDIRGKERYFIQLVMEGIPPKKIDTKTGEVKQGRVEGKVGIDIGTSTIAIVSPKEAKLFELAPSIHSMDYEKRLLHRKLDRQRRANNPDKYKEDGTVNRGNKETWTNSNNYIKTKRRLAEIQRKIANKRKQEHYRMVNWILTLGDDIKVETMRFNALQRRVKKTTNNEKTGKCKCKKRYGKTIANKAPSMLLTMLDQKLQYEGKALQKIDTFHVKASQYNHIEDSYIKKPLHQRWNDVGINRIQRDLYSAFLIMNVDDDLKTIDRNECIKHWESFRGLHDKEIDRLKATPTLSSMGVA
jgi:hypothetical protein